MKILAIYSNDREFINTCEEFGISPFYSSIPNRLISDRKLCEELYKRGYTNLAFLNTFTRFEKTKATQWETKIVTFGTSEELKEGTYDIRGIVYQDGTMFLLWRKYV